MKAMRKDMAKVIVERERLGGKCSRKGSPARSLEDLPKKESMKRPYKDTKSLNENLSPLKRFLNASVGRPWDKVYSEISKNLKVTSAVQQHVRDHIPDFVEKNCQIESNGLVTAIGRYYGKPTELRHGQLYVCPKTRFLKAYKKKKKKKKNLNQRSDFERALERLSRQDTKLVVEGEKVFKLFFDPHLMTYSIKQRATKAHAEQDFSRNFTFDSHAIKAFFAQYKEGLPKSEYFSEYQRLIALAETKAEEKRKKEIERLVGQSVLVSVDNGKSFHEGVINRVETYGTYFKTYFVSCGSKNIRISIPHDSKCLKFK